MIGQYPGRSNSQLPWLVIVRKEIVALVIAVASTGSIVASERTASRNPDALRQIVQEQCVVNWRAVRNPFPCARISLPGSGNTEDGFAVLHDIKGGAHYLLIPTKTISGMESSELSDPEVRNYFNDAWQARDFVELMIGHPLPRTAIGLAINARHSRTQNQFHVHIECIDVSIAGTLKMAADRLDDNWSPINISESTYFAMRVVGENLDQANPLHLLANKVPDARNDMGSYTLIVVGMDYRDGPGFVLLTGKHVPTGELLLDPNCKVSR